MSRHHLGPAVAICFAGAMAAGAGATQAAHAGPANTWSEYTVRSVSGTFPADHDTTIASSMSGGEPSIGFDAARNAAMYGSGTNVKRLTWDDSVSPATMTVADAKPSTAVTTLDAITMVDPYGHRSFNSQLLAACSSASFSDTAGATWTPIAGCGAGTALDHQTLGAGPFHSPLPTPPSPAYPDAIYYCAQNGFNESCALSANGGVSFGPASQISNTAANVPPTDPFFAQGGACSGLSGHVRVAPDGTAYVPLKGCGGTPTTQEGTNTEFQGGRPTLSVSQDNGTTWILHRVPATSVPDGLGGFNAVENPDESDPSLGISRPGGVLYFGWENGHNPPDMPGVPPVNGTQTQAMVAVSHDHGTTWSAPVDVSSALGIHNVQFPEVIAGDDDRAAFAFLGTADSGDDQTNAFPTDQPWHLYVATTYDGGATWTTQDTTPTDFVQRGCVDLQGTTIPPSGRVNICSQRNMLDFNDITIDREGRVLIALSDGCNSACESNPASGSAGAVDRVMRLSSGTFLLAAFSPKVPEGPTALAIPVLAVAVAIGVRRIRRSRRGDSEGG